MVAAGILRELSEDLKEDYFVLRDLQKYTDKMGLNLNITYGEAVIF